MTITPPLPHSLILNNAYTSLHAALKYLAHSIPIVGMHRFQVQCA